MGQESQFPERPDRPRVFHFILETAGVLGRTSPLVFIPAWVALAAIAAWPWGRPPLQIAAAALTLLTIADDGVLLSLLPRLHRSFGPVTPPLLALALLRVGLTLAIGARWPTSWPAFGGTAALQLALSELVLYATWVEPFRLTVSRLELTSSRLPQGGPPLRILHVSDVHFEDWSLRERRLLELARELAPDLVLLTGDYLNLSYTENPNAHTGARELLAALGALAPTYAVTGSPRVDLQHVIPSIFAGLPITWLMDETAELTVKGRRIQLVGVRCTGNRWRDGERLRRLLPGGAGEVFTVLLYHSPDLMPQVVGSGIDLYLAGHTHGGQVCLPLFGALITSSDFWKRYEAGRYEEGGTVLYVSRGLGMEGLGAPRARFFSPPELVVIEL